MRPNNFASCGLSQFAELQQLSAASLIRECLFPLLFGLFGLMSGRSRCCCHVAFVPMMCRDVYGLQSGSYGFNWEGVSGFNSHWGRRYMLPFIQWFRSRWNIRCPFDDDCMICLHSLGVKWLRKFVAWRNAIIRKVLSTSAWHALEIFILSNPHWYHMFSIFGVLRIGGMSDRRVFSLNESVKLPQNVCAFEVYSSSVVRGVQALCCRRYSFCWVDI